MLIDKVCIVNGVRLLPERDGKQGRILSVYLYDDLSDPSLPGTSLEMFIDSDQHVSLLSSRAIGQRCNLTFEMRESNGRTYKNFRKCEPIETPLDRKEKIS